MLVTLLKLKRLANHRKTGTNMPKIKDNYPLCAITCGYFQRQKYKSFLRNYCKIKRYEICDLNCDSTKVVVTKVIATQIYWS